MPFWHFSSQLSATKHGKAFLTRCETTLSSELFSLNFEAKRYARTRLIVTEWHSERHITVKHCNDVLLMFETAFFDHWVKHHLWWLLLQPHWFVNYFQCVIIRAGSLELIYIKWLWAAQPKSCLFALKNLLFCIFRIGAGSWGELDNFVIAALYFIKFNYWYGKRCTQYFSRYFSNQIQ